MKPRRLFVERFGVNIYSLVLRVNRSLQKNFATKAAAKNNRLEESQFQPVIGLEIHAQIDAKSKLFSGAVSNYWASTNTTVNFFDTALPGTLPVLNKRCVEAGVKAALALNCRLNMISLFDRKHYFYSDLPAGYQITQQRKPLAVEGWVEYVVFDEKNTIEPYMKRTTIKQIQLEQDSGKSIHDTKSNRSLIDLNRAGVALLEIVCNHDMENELEAACFAKEVHRILRVIGVCEGKMERGQFRVDANISIHRPDEPLGPRTEVKNLNSFRFIRRALVYEIGRQIELREAGKPVINETLAFDYRTGKTSPMRDKEVRQDYRYMPEPNLPPLVLIDSAVSTEAVAGNGSVDVNDIRKELPMLPADIRARWMEKDGLRLEHCVILEANESLSRLFPDIMQHGNFNGPKVVTVLALYAEVLEDKKIPIESSNIEMEKLAELIGLLDKDRISEHATMTVLRALAKGDERNPIEIIEERSLYVLEDKEEVERICVDVLAENASLVKRYQNGKENKIFLRLYRSVGSKLRWRYPERELELLLRQKLNV